MRRPIGALIVCAVAASGIAAFAGVAQAADIDPTAVTATVQNLNVAVSWSDSSDADVTGYVVSTVPASPTVEVPAGATSAVLTGLRPATPYSVDVTAQTTGGAGTPVAAPGVVRTAAPGGSFVALTPTRILDTRTGNGSRVGSTTVVALQVTGRGGIPLTGVDSVALNVTVAAESGGGYLTAYPAGLPRPTSSNVNFVAQRPVANMVIVKVGTGGQVVLFADARTQMIADVAGYFTTAGTASASSGLLHPLSPKRLMDTRLRLGGSAPGGNGAVALTVAGVGGVPAAGVSAVVLNVTAVSPTTGGYLTVWPAGARRPTASNVNFPARLTIANRVVVPVGADGQVSIFNVSGTTQLVVDVTGWFTDGSDTSAGGSYYVGLTPRRLIDTRIGLGGARSPVASQGVLGVQIAGSTGVPAAALSTPATAAVMTMTAITSTVGTYATAFPSLTARPIASDVNANPRAIVPGLIVSSLGVDGGVDIFNLAGPTGYVVDLSGYFIGGIHAPSSTITPAPGAITQVTGSPGGTQTVTIAAGNTAPQIGDIVTSGVSPTAPDGLLAQVTGTATDGSGNTVVTTQAATLQQALGDASIALTAPLTAADVVSTQAVTDGRSVPTGRTGSIGVPQLRARIANPLATDPVTDQQKQTCQGDSGTSVVTTAEVDPTLNVSVQIGHHGLTPTVTADTGVSLHEEIGTTVTYDAKGTCSWDKTLKTFNFKPVTFDVAGVPVVIVPVLTLKLKATISGQATVSASVTQTFDADAGLHYDGSTVTPYHDLTNTIAHTGPTLTAANVDASVALTADLQGKLYDVTGPDVAITGTLKTHASVLENPWWTLTFVLSSDVAFHFDKFLVHVDVSVSITLFDKVLAQASGTSTTAPPVITTLNLPAATLGDLYTTSLTTADHRTGTWAISGSLPAGLTLNGFTISGTPTAPGSYTFVLVFTDTQGHRVQGSATITVGGSVPSVTTTPAPPLWSAAPLTHCPNANFPTQITINGRHFDPFEGYSFDIGFNGYLGVGVEADANGNITKTVNTPEMPAGEWDVDIQGDTHTASTVTDIGYDGCLSHSGTLIEWSGNGWGEDDSVNLAIDGSTVGSYPTDDFGTFDTQGLTACPSTGQHTWTISEGTLQLGGTTSCTITDGVRVASFAVARTTRSRAEPSRAVSPGQVNPDPASSPLVSARWPHHPTH